MIDASVHPRPPGLTRRPTGRDRPRFEYLDPTGQPVTDPAELARLAALAVPPAWTHVWFSADPGSKVQAVGVDAAGRTQYRYSAEWTSRRSAEKFAHVPGFAGALPTLRARVAADLAADLAPPAPALTRDRVLAAAVRLLDLGFFRVGSERYARDNDTYGLTTLQRRHVRVDGDVVHVDYTAKEHLHRVVDVRDGDVAPVVAALLTRDDDDPALLAWHAPDGSWHPVHSAHVNSYVHAWTGIDATAKQFRTWAGTVLAAAALGGAEHGERSRSPVVAAVRATSRLLGNTPAVARASYVHPAVLAAYADGRTASAAVADAGRQLGDSRLATVWTHPAVQAAALDLIDPPASRTAGAAGTIDA